MVKTNLSLDVINENLFVSNVHSHVNTLNSISNNLSVPTYGSTKRNHAQVLNTNTNNERPNLYSTYTYLFSHTGKHEML